MYTRSLSARKAGEYCMDGENPAQRKRKPHLRNFAVVLSPGCIPLHGDRNASVADLNDVGGEFVQLCVDKLFM